MSNKYELSSHLIHKVQILLKKEAGLDSFTSMNDEHSHSQSLDSSFFKEAIVGSNPSVDVDISRCEHCSGELLRGSQSIICVYCGRAQHQHSIPNPLSFKSTFAFQWFLQSLGLNGNESIGIPLGTPSGDRERGFSVKEDQIPLSDFLDLQLKWGENSSGFGLRDEEQVPKKTYLSLIGVDIEELLSQESRDHGSSVGNEQTTENQEFRVSGERNLSLFENTEPSEAASRSGEGGNDESFADWGAEFQSAIPDRGLEKSVNISFSDDLSGSNLNVSSNNFLSNMEASSQPFDFEKSDDNIWVEGGGKALESVDSSIDWLPADELHTTKKDSTNNEIRDDDDSFDEWGDFRMSTTDKITQGEPTSTVGLAIDSSDGLGISDIYNDLSGFIVSKDIQIQKDNFTVPDDAWKDLMIPSSGGDIPSQTNSDKPELLVGTGDLPLGKEKNLALLDGTSLEHQGVHVESMQNKIPDQSGSLGLWGNDIHLDNIGDQSPHKDSKLGETTTNLVNSFDLWNGLKGSDNQQATNTEVADSKISTEGGSTFDACNQRESSALWNDNSLDEWSDFTGSTGVSNSKPIANDDASGTWNDFSSLVVTHANLQSSNTRTYDDQAVLEEDNLFSSWSDFCSLGLQTGNSSVGPNDINISSDRIIFQKSPNSLENVDNHSTIDSWDDFGVATSILEQQLQASGAGASGDFFSGVSNHGKQSTSQHNSQVYIFDGKSMGENDESFGAWGDFTTSSKALTNLSSTVNVPTYDDKEAVNYGDLLDAWDGILSSPDVQAHKDTAGGMGKTSESNLFSPNMNSQYVGTRRSMHMDLDIGMFIDQNGSAPAASAQSEVSDLVKPEHGDVKADGYTEGNNFSESSSKEGLDLKASIAETLMSEMHDLSFMLESSLSIPNSGT